MTDLLIFLALLGIGLIFGRANERRHLKRLQEQEAQFAHIKVYTLKSVPKHMAAELEAGGIIVSGSVVIAIDYFKRIIAGLKMLIGGNLGSYESLVARARREAILRMQKHADSLGADIIFNARIEFSIIGQQPKSSGAELLAYGTAVKLRSTIASQ